MRSICFEIISAIKIQIYCNVVAGEAYLFTQIAIVPHRNLSDIRHRYT